MRKTRQGDKETRRQGDGGTGRAPHLLVSLSPCLLVFLAVGCADGGARRGPDPLTGNREPLPAGGSAAPAPVPVSAAGPPPVPVAGSTLPTAALASGATPKPLEGGHELGIRDGWQGQAALGQPEPVTGTPVSRRDPAPVARAAAPGVRLTTFEQGQATLAARGVQWQRLETAGDGGDWKFSCALASPKNPNLSRSFEARARTPLAAVQMVLDQVEKEMP